MTTQFIRQMAAVDARNRFILISVVCLSTLGVAFSTSEPHHPVKKSALAVEYSGNDDLSDDDDYDQLLGALEAASSADGTYQPYNRYFPSPLERLVDSMETSRQKKRWEDRENRLMKKGAISFGQRMEPEMKQEPGFGLKAMRYGRRR